MKLRIALVHPFSWPEVRRGGERYLYDLACYLDRAGHNVEVITGTSGRSSKGSWGGAVVRRLRHLSSGPLSRVDPNRSFGARALPTLIRGRFDVVHCFTPSAALAARAARRRTLYTVLGHPSAELVSSLPGEARHMGRAIRSSTAVAALSRASADATRRAFGRAAWVLPPGVAMDQFQLEAGARTGPPRILFTAFASNPEKGLATLVRAFRMVLDQIPEARLVLAGPGDPAPALSTLGPDLERVTAAIDHLGEGRIDDVPALYRNATVTALPSTNEAFGLVLVESLASGTPVVCSAAGGMPEIVDRPTIGRAVPYGDADALARALVETIALARDPLTPRRCREHAGRWGWRERVGGLHEDVYRKILEGSNEPG